MTAPGPPLRPRPTLSMKDMGMGGMDHGSMAGMDHSSHGAATTAGATASMAGLDHVSSGPIGGMNIRDTSLVPPTHKVGVGEDANALPPVDRTVDLGIGHIQLGTHVTDMRDM